jgi:hypothetical protein
MFDDVNGTFSFYIDGANKWDRSNTGGSNIANALNVPILIGSRMEKDSQHSFTGSIDDVMIFNKILSNNEIQELYNQSNNGYTNTFTSLALGDHTSQIFSADLTGSKDWSEERTFTIEAEPVAPPFANYGEEGIDGLSTSTAYTIATCEQLQNIATSSGIYLDKYFRLEPVGTSTIDCLETSGWNSYEGEGTQYYGFEPIGDSEVAFSGYFDGNNKIISNLYIDRYNTNYVGLFGYVEPGESEGTGRIENINLTNVNINGDYYVGALAGYLGGTTGNHGMIKNASSSGETEAYTLGAGGLIGLVGTYGDVEDSSSSSNVNSGYKAGGLAGVVQGSINNCSATGEINTDAYGAGGLVGYLKGGIVIESYATGDVNGGSSDSSLDQESSYAGGLVGLVNLGQIYRSYATGNVIGESIRVGGLVGGTNSIVENSYAWGNVEGADRVGGLVGGLTGEITNSYSIGTVTAGALVLNEGDEQTSYDGGGGGGGYFGGEGGQSDGIPGAGGSGYASSSVEDWILTTGNNGAGGERALPPNTTDENYVTGVGLGGIHNLNSGNGLVYLDYGSGDITFSYTGGSQTFTVPVGVTSISAKIWGAGGGGSSYSEEYQGGSGGYASGTILVTPLDTLVIIVGGGGGRAYANIIGGIGGYGGGGYGTRGDAAGGGGGGLSGIFTDENGTSFESLTQGDAVLIAGGGGGGTGYSGPGGAGGGEEGNNGGDDESCGGTQEAGGSCLENGSDGSALRGGNGDSTGIKGTAIPEYDYAGGLIGYSTGTTTNSYWDIESSEQENSPAGGTGTSTEVMKSQGTFSGWNFTDIWSIDNNYPLLRAFGSDGTNDNTPTVDVPVHRNTVIGSYVQTTRNPIVYSGVSGCEFVDTLINIGVISISESLSAKSLLGCDKILSTTTAYYFPRNLKLGMTGDDVKELQKFLNTHGFSLTKNGDGSAGFETTIFGSLTKNALIKFQEANFDDVLKPLNLTKGTGLFYDSTRTFVNKLLK